jgi:arylformamidase
MKNFEIFDISPSINSKLAVFPGDTNFSLTTLVDFDHGNNFKLCTMKCTTHLGAHTDAPIHYDKNSEDISQVPLSSYFGNCQVIDLSHATIDRIRPEHIKNIKIESDKILFKTNSYDPYKWSNQFTALSSELIFELSKKFGVKLVAIDTPSIDPAEDKNLESHKAIAINKMAILEGISLNQISAGKYYLSALPLKIEAGDASPVRAILFKIKEDRQK